MIRNSILVTSLVACALAAVVPTASDAATSRIIYYSATDSCEAIDPSNFTGLRFRTLGVYNASTSSIQIACALPAEFVADNGATDIWLSLRNFKNVPLTVNCTVFGGSRIQGTNSYPTSGQIAANASTWRTFSSIDRVSNSYTHYSVSCILPPGVELSLIRVNETDVDDTL